MESVALCLPPAAPVLSSLLARQPACMRGGRQRPEARASRFIVAALLETTAVGVEGRCPGTVVLRTLTVLEGSEQSCPEDRNHRCKGKDAAHAAQRPTDLKVALFTAFHLTLFINRQT